MRETFRNHFKRVATRGHAYPPMELYTPVPFEAVRSAWAAFVREDKTRKLGIYVHLPFCERKCAFCYCDTIITDDDARVQRYLDALDREIDLFAPTFQGRKVDTVYLGGGTPTHLSAAQLDRLLERLQTRFVWSSDVHLNIEGTPRSITPEKAAVLQKWRTDRVTLGVQSTDDAILIDMNRPQSWEDLERAVALVRGAGVKWLNFDLVAGLPDDTPELFEAGLRRLVALGPNHVHVYPFSEKPGFAENPHKQAIVARAEAVLREAGFRHARGDGWVTDEAAACQQIVDKTERAGSCLGLGIRARSHIFNRLAYRSHFTREYEDSLLAGEVPEYRGVRLTRRLQMQRFLMDNLPVGVDVAAFHDLFGLDPIRFLQAEHPAAAKQLKKQGAREITVNDAVRAGQKINELLFDPRLRERLYGVFVGQPEGWPEGAAAPFEPDLNWLHYLAWRLSKGNTYPPILAADGLPHDQVQTAWADLAGRIRRGEALETIGIYLHVPWCASICKFCYCYKNLLEKPEILDAYVDAVIDQAAAVAPLLQGIRMRSLYVGGGTPSVLSAAQMERLFGALYGMFQFMDGHQFNIEGTPATLARGDRIPTLARLGVNRLTIGVQSLERHLLEHMNRTQSGPQVIEEVVQSARAHGIKHINMDLMAGLPEQTFEDWERSIEELVRWRPDVIHVYPFQPTHETTYYKEGFRVTPEIEALRTRMLEHAEKVLRAEGWKDVPHDSYALSLEARNQQDVDKIVNAASILPLGYNARGHVFGGLSYGTLEAGFKQYMEDRSKADFYYGLPVSLEDDMVRWTISNLMTGIDRERFHAIFGVDIVERFPAQLRWLQERGLIDVQLTRIVSKMETSAESVVWSKVFFDDKYHVMLRERFKDEYKPEVDWVEEWRKMYAQGF